MRQIVEGEVVSEFQGLGGGQDVISLVSRFLSFVIEGFLVDDLNEFLV